MLDVVDGLQYFAITVMLLAGCCIFRLGLPLCEAELVTVVVPDDLPTIQEAINNVADGGVVFVKSGLYSEHVVVNRSMSIVGENRFTTVIDGMGDDAVNITASGVNLTGFTIQGGKNVWPVAGIFLEHAGWCNIYGNTLTNGFYGLSLDESCYNNVSGNDIVDNSIGICGFNSSSNDIVGNNITGNSFAGINLHLCSSNKIVENHIESNSKGMRLLDGADRNIIYHNNFISNGGQVFIVNSFENIWDNGDTSGGNFWIDHNPPDEDRDKIGDMAYIIGVQAEDLYPLIYSYRCYQLGYVPSTDVNEDGTVSIVDMAMLAKAFGCKPGGSDWNPKADLDMNETINIVDITLAAKNYGTNV